jgi:hypothetical protein
MGCDIHMYSEQRTPDGKWEAMLHDCDHCDGTGDAQEKRVCQGCGRDYEAWDGNFETIALEDHHASGKCLYGLGSLLLKPTVCRRCKGTKMSPADIYGSRNYRLFGVLAGVRGAEDPNFTRPNRGVPDNASAEYHRQAEGEDWHSHTWYTLTELLERNWDDFSEFKEVVNTLKERLGDGDTDDIRIVFFFDN